MNYVNFNDSQVNSLDVNSPESMASECFIEVKSIDSFFSTLFSCLNLCGCAIFVIYSSVKKDLSGITGAVACCIDGLALRIIRNRQRKFELIESSLLTCEQGVLMKKI